MKYLITIFFAMLVTLTPKLLLADDFAHVDPQAKLLFNKAIEAFKTGDIETAASHAGLAWRKDRAVLAMDDQGMIDGFDKYLRAEIKQSPDDATDYYRLAKLQAIRGVPQEAESLLKKVVELTPGTPLARKSRTLIRGLAESLAERAFLAADKEEFIKEARQKATIENIKFSNKEQAEENARKMKQNQAVAQATKTKESAAKDKEIAELKKQGEKDKLYSNLFWANPTNAYLMENNYDKTRIEANLSNKGVMETIPLAITRP